MDSLSNLDSKLEDKSPSLRHRRTEALGRLSATEAPNELAEKGLLTEDLTNRAADTLWTKLRANEGTCSVRGQILSQAEK